MTFPETLPDRSGSYVKPVNLEDLPDDPEPELVLSPLHRSESSSGSSSPRVKIKSLAEVLRRTSTQVISQEISSVNAEPEWSHYDQQITHMALNDHSYFAKFERNPICGYVILQITEDSVGKIPYIGTTRKMQGVGSALLHRAVKEAKAKGCKEIRLDCRNDLLGFYRKFAVKEGLSLREEPAGEYAKDDPKTNLIYTLMK